jgi:alkylhydroperoxidase family enzyme
MAVVNPLPKDKAAAEVHGLYDKLQQNFGFVPNIFAAMAQRPAALNAFVPLYGAIVNQGTVEARYKELVYLKVSLSNACEY